MNAAATQIASREFDADFFRLPSHLQSLIQKKIDEMGLRLGNFSHYRMTGSEKYRLRAGDYRIIYRFDLIRQEIYLIAIGHRREVYRTQ
jgi:mRNA interferase RelE/StbE